MSILDRPGESCHLSIEYSYSILLAVLETIKVSVNLVSNNTMRAAVVRLSAAAPDFAPIAQWLERGTHNPQVPGSILRWAHVIL